MNSRQLGIFGIIVSIFLVMGLLVLANRSNSPKVVVNMPQDAAPLTALAPLLPSDKIVGPDRAVLWWTVFNKAADHSLASTAASIADQAVLTVYGPVK